MLFIFCGILFKLFPEGIWCSDWSDFSQIFGNCDLRFRSTKCDIARFKPVKNTHRDKHINTEISGERSQLWQMSYFAKCASELIGLPFDTWKLNWFYQLFKCKSWARFYWTCYKQRLHSYFSEKSEKSVDETCDLCWFSVGFFLLFVF